MVYFNISVARKRNHAQQIDFCKIVSNDKYMKSNFSVVWLDGQIQITVNIAEVYC